MGWTRADHGDVEAPQRSEDPLCLDDPFQSLIYTPVLSIRLWLQALHPCLKKIINNNKNTDQYNLWVALKVGTWCRLKRDFLMYCCLKCCHIVLTVRALGNSEMPPEWCVSLPRLWQLFVLFHHAKLSEHHKACLYLWWDLGLVQEIGQVYLPQHVSLCFLPLA